MAKSRAAHLCLCPSAVTARLHDLFARSPAGLAREVGCCPLARLAAGPGGGGLDGAEAGLVAHIPGSIPQWEMCLDLSIVGGTDMVFPFRILPKKEFFKGRSMRRA